MRKKTRKDKEMSRKYNNKLFEFVNGITPKAGRLRQRGCTIKTE